MSRLKIDMAGALANAIDQLNGTEHPLRGAPDEESRASSAAMLEQILEHCQLLKSGRALPTDFLSFYCLTADVHAPLVNAADYALTEAFNAANAWPPYNSAHEGFAIIHEEVDELKAHVWTNQKRRDLEAMKTEAIQVAATAIRFAADCCTEERGRR
ncbi:hypothetical protein [Brevundimonas nasdae]|uniref:hypothetical protein n=1 Tax=Brevundimonas nasdae TaxID=172043 RepID=UPI003F68C685